MKSLILIFALSCITVTGVVLLTDNDGSELTEITGEIK